MTALQLQYSRGLFVCIGWCIRFFPFLMRVLHGVGGEAAEGLLRRRRRLLCVTAGHHGELARWLVGLEHRLALVLGLVAPKHKNLRTATWQFVVEAGRLGALVP